MRFIDPKADGWRRAEGHAPEPAERLLLTPAQWQAVQTIWPATLPVGLALPNDADVEALAGELDRFAVVALDFPKFTDGRAYSQARLLRARLRYAGELRAGGDVIVDMLPLLARTGVDAVQLRADQKPEAARRALDFFPGHYQADVHETRPLFARGAR